MSELIHIPVLTEHVLDYLDPKPGKCYLDVTFGMGGHTRAILEREPTCRVIALDWDKTALDTYGEELKKEFPERLTLLWGNFAHLYKIAKKEDIEKVDGILADFGPSTIQLKGKAGFSFADDTPLDMRMSTGHHTVTAAQVINMASEKELCEIFAHLGEERYANRIARAIVQKRKQKLFATTGQLADLVMSVVPKDPRSRIHPATRVFQALRIYVNKELDNISAFLKEAVRILAPGGRLVCISFHSLEDRLVKQFFLEQKQKGIITIVTPKVVVADENEIKANPSSRSARLRAAERIE